MKDGNGLTIPGTEGDTWEDNPYAEQEPPDVIVRCILCGETMERRDFDMHDCDIIPWEEVPLDH